MARFVDLSGRVFGRLLAVERAPNIGKKTAYLCLCECNDTCTVNADSLRAGHTKSCGCLHKEAAAKRGKQNRLSEEARQVSKERRRKLDYAAHLRKEFNLTPQDVEAMRTTQENRCRICSKIFDKTPHVDHDHETGKVRELLCGPCNSVIGLVKEDTNILLAAIKYLKSHVE